MKIIEIKLKQDEFWPLMNILNEVCHGINIKNFEIVIGEKEEKFIEFVEKIANEEDKDNIILSFNEEEQTIIKRSFEEVFKQIDDWEFQTRIGITRQQAEKIKNKLYIQSE